MWFPAVKEERIAVVCSWKCSDEKCAKTHELCKFGSACRNVSFCSYQHPDGKRVAYSGGHVAKGKVAAVMPVPIAPVPMPVVPNPGLKPMRDYLAQDVLTWLEDRWLGELKPHFQKHAMVGANFINLTLDQMERLEMGSEHLQQSFIRFRDEQLEKDDGAGERLQKRARLHLQLNELKKSLCRQMHEEECKVEEIRASARKSIPWLSDVLKLDWEEERKFCDQLQVLTEIPKNNTHRQRPKKQTVEGLLEIAKLAQPQFKKALEGWLRLMKMSPEDALVLGPVKTLQRATDKAEEVGLLNLLDLTRATILCKDVSQILNLTNHLIVVFIQPMLLKNKFPKQKEGEITEPPCLFYQIGFQLTGEAASLLEDPSAPWIVEVQVTTAQFYYTKQLSHQFYDITRESLLPQRCPFCHTLIRAAIATKTANETVKVEAKQATVATKSATSSVATVEVVGPSALAISSPLEDAQSTQKSVETLKSLGTLLDIEEPAGPEVNAVVHIVDGRVAVNENKIQVCSHCGKKGHDKAGCFVAHPQLQLDALKTAVKMIVGQFGEGPPQNKVIGVSQLAQLWRFYADAKPTLFKGFTLPQLVDSDPKLFRLDANAHMCYMTTPFTPCQTVLDGNNCVAAHGPEVRHSCLFGSKCPVSSVCVFHRKLPIPRITPRQQKKEVVEPEAKDAPPSKKGPVRVFQTLVTIVSLFGTARQQSAVIPRSFLEELCVEYNKENPNKALPSTNVVELLASLPQTDLMLHDKEVTALKPIFVCQDFLAGNCHGVCPNRHRCVFSSQRCPHGKNCKLSHDKVKKDKHTKDKPDKDKHAKDKPEKEKAEKGVRHQPILKIGAFRPLEEMSFFLENGAAMLKRVKDETGCSWIRFENLGKECSCEVGGTQEQIEHAFSRMKELKPC